jgi:hypothetical protein
VTPQGLGAKAGLDMQGAERRRRDLPSARQEFHLLRERWATLTNEALREANVAARVDHRSFAERGIDREPSPNLPLVSLKMEQRGLRSEVAERIREEYRQRVAARLERAAGTHPTRGVSPGKDSPVQVKDVEEIRRQARAAWRQLAAGATDGHGARQPAGREIASDGREREAAVGSLGHDDDLTL